MEKALIVDRTTENDVTFEVGYTKIGFMSNVAYIASYRDGKLLWERNLNNKFNSYFTSVKVYDDYIYTAGMRIDRNNKDWREGVLCKWSMNGDLIWERKVAIQQYHDSLTIIPPKCSILNEHVFVYSINPFIHIVAGSSDDFNSVTTKLDPYTGNMWVRNYLGGEYYEWNEDFNQDLHPIRKLYHAAVELFM